MKNVFVTGGAGYICSHACKTLARCGFSPDNIDKLLHGNRSAVNWGPLGTLDIADMHAVADVTEKYAPVSVPQFVAYAYAGELVSLRHFDAAGADSDGELEENRDPVTHLMLLILDGAGSDAFNLGTGNGHSVRGVIDGAERFTGRAIPVESGPRRPGDPPTLVAESSRARDGLGWTPQWSSLENIIDTAWRWHEKSNCSSAC